MRVRDLLKPKSLHEVSATLQRLSDSAFSGLLHQEALDGTAETLELLALTWHSLGRRPIPASPTSPHHTALPTSLTPDFVLAYYNTIDYASRSGLPEAGLRYRYLRIGEWLGREIGSGVIYLSPGALPSIRYIFSIDPQPPFDRFYKQLIRSRLKLESDSELAQIEHARLTCYKTLLEWMQRLITEEDSADPINMVTELRVAETELQHVVKELNRVK